MEYLTMSSLLAFFFGSFLFLGLASVLWRSPVLRRLERELGTEETVAPSFRGLLLHILEPLATRASGGGEQVRQRLVQAGFHDEAAQSIYIGGRMILPVVLLALAMLAGNTFNFPPFPRMMALIIGAGLGYVGPSFALDKIRARRQRMIRLSLPDALDLMVVCLEAGVSMGAAIARVAREFSHSSPPLCDELRLITAEMQAGKAGADALRAFSDRVGIEEVSALVAMLIQAERFGTSVADSLRIHTTGMRTDRLQKAEERAQKAAVRLLFPAAALIFPATLIVLMGPAMISFADAFSR
jgi:tight adherence protein C